MSHFTVAVIIPGKEVEQLKLKRGASLDDTISDLVDNALAPFDENTQVKPYRVITPEGLKKEFNMAVQRSKNKKDAWGKMARQAGATKSPKHYMDWCYSHYEKDAEGWPLTTYNPNSKWDWYSIGGRWDNIVSNNYNVKGNYCQLKDLKFKKDISDERREELTKQYTFLSTTEPNEELKEWANDNGVFKWYKESYFSQLYPTLESYIDSETSFSTYAILTSKGEWLEPGEMGWFGISSATAEDTRNFKNKYEEILKTEDKENYIVVVDCHI